jgi:hypothetical protein
MFTQSCCDVKVASLAVQHKRSNLGSSKQIDAEHAFGEVARRIPMLDNILHWRPHWLAAHNENLPSCQIRAEAAVSTSNVRALATGAALAVSVDASPAVLVSIYDYAHRYRDKARRTA